MYSARQEQIIVHYGGKDMKCLAAVAYVARRFAGCRLLDLELALESDMPEFQHRLLSALKAGSGQLGSVAAFRFALERGVGTIRGLVGCQEWLLPRMTGLHALSLSAGLYTALGHLTSLRHLMLSVRWHPSLVQVLGGLSPCLESLMLQSCGSEPSPPKGQVLDVRHLKRLSRLALRYMFRPCELLLPEGCQVYLKHCNRTELIFGSAKSCITGVVMRFVMPFEWEQAADTALLGEMQAVPGVRELTLVPDFRHQAALRLNAKTLAPLRHLTSLRVFSSFYENKSRAEVEVRLPACLEVRCLVLAAHSVSLAFEGAAVSVARLTELKVLCGWACSERQALQSEVEPHLQAGLCLVLCDLEGHDGEEVEGLYIKRSGECDVAPADLLCDRCLCRCCWECLQLDGKLLPST
jgi:hypothetical protein